MPDRRQFASLALTPLLGLSMAASAQDQPQEGRHYLTLSTRQPTLDRSRVEVLEFFAYSCHHCHDFEPALDAWQKKLPADVSFRRIPVAFRDDLVVHNALYFAIDTLGLVERLHRKVFEAVHASPGGMKGAREIVEFLQGQGVDAAQVVESMKSFVVATRTRQAFALANGYGVEGTPSLGIDGRWLTSGGLAGTNARSLVVADFLVALAKRSR